MEGFFKKNSTSFFKFPREWSHHIFALKNFKTIRHYTNSTNFDNTILKEKIHELVACENGYYPHNMKYLAFPGPMASNLSVKNISLIRDIDYYITEKSDGIRTMMFSIFLPHYPRWRYFTSKGVVPFNSKDSAVLESYYLIVTEKRMRVKSKKFSQSMPEFGNMNLQLSSKENPISVFHNMKVSEYDYVNTQCVLNNPKTNQNFILERRVGFTLNFLFDRTFNFYLCSDEFVFPTYKWMKGVRMNPKLPCLPQKQILVDGEIVFNLIQKKWNYSIYDVVCYDEGGAKEISCNAMNMRQKIDIMVSRIVEPHHFFYSHFKMKKPQSLNVVRKRFYPKSEIETVFKCIRKREDGEYVYKNYNKNDGLIFTPDSVDFYHFVPGPSMKLFKWKWGDKLSSDFEIQYDPRTKSMNLYYLHSSKNPYTYFFRTTDAISMIDFSPEVQGKLTRRETVIVELFYAVEKNDWKIMCVRSDKVRPNTILTIASVFTGMIEGITREQLIDVISKKKRLPSIDEEFEREIWMQDLFVHLTISFIEKKRNRIPILTCNHDGKFPSVFLYVKDCIHVLEDEEMVLQDEKMEDYIRKNYPKSNAITVRCVFLPSSGKWKIIDFNGRWQNAGGDVLLKTLEEMLKISRKIRGGKDGNNTLLKRTRDFQNDFENSGKRSKID